MTDTVLILGASGRFGRHAAEAFWNAGWQVRTFDRKSDDLMTAAQGVAVIVNAWNPPYPQWAREVPRFTADVIAAAKQSGATVIIPGNVYVFGKVSAPLFDIDTPHAATNPLGRIRIEMETAYRNAGVSTILLRAGDFIDTEASGNWFDMMIAAKAANGRISAPGDLDAKHAWAYLPDLARAAVQLAERRETLDIFEDVPFPGYTLTLRELADLITIASGRVQKVTRLNWLPIVLAAPFWPMGRKLREMRYLWSMPHEIAETRFNELLPEFRATDPLSAIGAAIAHLKIDPDQPMPRGKAHVAAE